MAVEEVPEKWTNLGHQYCATIAVNIIAISLGSVIGWLSPALPILTSDRTPLVSGPLTNEEFSWIGSIDCVGAVLGTLSYGFFTTRLGSKRVLLFLSAPNFIAFWVLIYFGDKYYHILIARFFGGIVCGGVQSAIVLFVSEIANDDIRGRLGSFLLVLRSVGTLIGYVLGASFEYKIVPCICVFIPITFMIIFMMIPNTPQYYLRKGQMQLAEDALKFYKGYKDNRDHQEDYAIHKEFERLKAVMSERKKDEKLKLADFCNRSAMEGLSIGILLVSFTQLTGCFTITSYAVMTFAKVGTHMDPYTSSIMLAVALILGALTTTYLADKLGRRMSNLISMLGSAFGLLATALYYYLNLIGYDLSAFAWVPVVCLSIVVYLSSAGIIPLSFVCSIEYLPAKIRTYGMAIICAALSIAVFVSQKMYPILLDSIDLHGTLMIYGIGSIGGFIFMLFVLKETSGKSLDDVGRDETRRH